MDPDESNSKRKRLGLEPASLGRWLHPRDSGEWRGSKKARSVSDSRSPSPSGASGLSEVSTSEPGGISRNSRGLAKLLPQSRERSSASNRRPSPQPPDAVSRDPGTVNAATSTRNLTSTARLGLEEAFRKLRIVTDTICPPLCSAIDDLTACLHVFEVTTNNRQEYNDLTDELKCLVEQLVRYLHTSPSEDIADSISNISEAIRKEIESIGARQSRGGLRRILDVSGDDEDLRRRYRRIKQLFQQILGEASMSTWSITREHYTNTQLESLRPAKLARFDSTLATEINRRTCTESTRTGILQESLAWTEDPNGAKIYWMNGMAGTGKTTIATTLCAALGARRQLAASFFCTRTSPECREAKRIIPTIAYQFARRSTPFRSALCKVLKEDPDISTGNISSQFELLLRRPLMTVNDKLPDNLVIVIDALDECADPHIVELFLNLVFRSLGNMPIKLYLTSRPEPAIRNKMMPESERARSILYLHEIEKSLVQADIELYLKEELEFMSPAEFDIRKLAEHAGNLFIYAATAVRYIRPMGKAVNSQARLLAILATNTESKQKLSRLDELYATILAAAIDDQDLEPEEQTSIKLVLWTAICACESILIETLSVLCGLNNRNTTVNALQPLRSVLHVSDRSELVTTLHASFPDYMLAQERSGVFFCDQAVHSQFLAQRCFEIMQTQLRFNIGCIQSSFIPDNEISGLENRINANISAELFYSCRFWADHISQTRIVKSLAGLTHGFLSKQLLFWMEVLNLKKCIASGVVSLTKLNKRLWDDSNAAHDDLRKLTHSASVFIIKYISGLASAYTPHIYISLLPLGSLSGPLHLHYLPRFKGLIKLSGTLMDRLAGSALSNWGLEIEFKCAAYCPISDLIVLGSGAGEISVQNAYNGKHLVQPYKAHDSAIQCLDISSNGMWIASGSYDNTLCIWSVQDGSLVTGPYRGHLNLVTSVKFSPSSTHLVSGSNDCTVGVWSASDSSIPMRSFAGHKKSVNSVDFSPDETRIVSSSDDNTIRVWNLSNGATILVIRSQKVIIEQVNLVRFTPDGARIISASCGASSGRLLHTWNALDGSLCTPLTENCLSKFLSVAISSKGDRVATASSDGAVHVWDRCTGKLVASPIKSHSSSIRFIAFSDDSMRIISVFNDKTVQVWNAHEREAQTKILSSDTKRSTYPFFVISPDRARVAETTTDCIHIWDIESGALVTTIHAYSSGATTGFVQFSLDGTRIFSLDASMRFRSLKIDATTRQRIKRRGPRLSEIPMLGNLKSAACSPDGTRIVTCSTEEVELWDAQSCISISRLKLERFIQRPHSVEFTFSQSGNRLFTKVIYASRTVLQVWNGNNGISLARPFSVTQVLDISPDGTTILCIMDTPSSVTGGALHLIDVDKRKTTCLTNISFNQNSSWTANFSHDGLHVCYTSSDMCEIWDISNRTLTRVKLVRTDHLQSLSYSPNGWCHGFSTSEEQGKPPNFQSRRFRVKQPFHTTIDRDGWLRDDKSRPLFWVPPEIRAAFPKGCGISIEKGRSLYVDYNDMLAGNEWSKCYIDD